nr:ABC transporter ATP-binding protein [uncultured Oscillibacter sp.]
MIELKNLSAGYGGRDVVHGVSLAFSPGRVLALLGPNGCGKSTLLRTALGLNPKSGGEVLMDGTPMESLTPRERALKAAYLSQSRSVPNITAYKMVLHGRFPHLSYPRRYRKEDYEAVDRALERADAADVARRSMGELSGGQRQKVYLAMALAQETPTLLMDEPTTFLDVGHQLEVMAAARRLAEEGRAVVMVLHDLPLAMRGADDVALLSDGRLAAYGTAEEVYRSGALDQVFGVALCRVETASGWQYYYGYSQNT